MFRVGLCAHVSINDQQTNPIANSRPAGVRRPARIDFMICNLLEQRKPKSIRIAALLDKPDRRLRPVKVDYVGFTIPDELMIGYGLDCAEDYRNLPDICILKK
jgi:hypothetical protein